MISRTPFPPLLYSKHSIYILVLNGHMWVTHQDTWAPILTHFALICPKISTNLSTSSYLTFWALVCAFREILTRDSKRCGTRLDSEPRFFFTQCLIGKHSPFLPSVESCTHTYIPHLFFLFLSPLHCMTMNAVVWPHKRGFFKATHMHAQNRGLGHS